MALDDHDGIRLLPASCTGHSRKTRPSDARNWAVGGVGRGVAPVGLIRRENVIFSGTARRHWVPPFKGSLSVKSVISGAACWQADGRRFLVHQGTWLPLNGDQEYTLEIDSAEAVTTFCLFFRDGFVEDVIRNFKHSEDHLLDNPLEQCQVLELPVHIRPRPSRITDLLNRMFEIQHQPFEKWEDLFFGVAAGLATEQDSTPRLSERLAATKLGTRTELLRRIQRGVDFMLSNLGRRITTRDAAREAFLSEFHFHRAFTAIYSCTPHRFLSEQRLLHAAELLQSSAGSVTQICHAIGFDSLGSFSSAFAKRFGVSPQSFRRMRTDYDYRAPKPDASD
jgi:AraC family transcriptional regulator